MIKNRIVNEVNRKRPTIENETPLHTSSKQVKKKLKFESPEQQRDPFSPNMPFNDDIIDKILAKNIEEANSRNYNGYLHIPCYIFGFLEHGNFQCVLDFFNRNVAGNASQLLGIVNNLTESPNSIGHWILIHFDIDHKMIYFYNSVSSNYEPILRRRITRFLYTYYASINQNIDVSTYTLNIVDTPQQLPLSHDCGVSCILNAKAILQRKKTLVGGKKLTDARKVLKREFDTIRKDDMLNLPKKNYKRISNDLVNKMDCENSKLQILESSISLGKSYEIKKNVTHKVMSKDTNFKKCPSKNCIETPTNSIEQNLMTFCIQCRHWYHIKCARIEEEAVKEMKYYVCKDCESVS